MFNIVRASKIGAALIAGAVVLGSAPTPSYAETGSVRFSVGSAGFIVGIGGGSGVLSFKGRSYRAEHRRHQGRHHRRVCD